MERILLQTIKFDLMVEHPYAYLMKFAKLIKGTSLIVDKLLSNMSNLVFNVSNKIFFYYIDFLFKSLSLHSAFYLSCVTEFLKS